MAKHHLIQTVGSVLLWIGKIKAANERNGMDLKESQATLSESEAKSK